MDNLEKLATYGTQNEEKQSKSTTICEECIHLSKPFLDRHHKLFYHYLQSDMLHV
jgi:hypothetical protein